MKLLKSIRAWFSRLFTKEEIPMGFAMSTSATTVNVGATAQLSTSEASGFTSSDSSIATVDSTGLITGVAAGSVTITAIALSDATMTVTLDLTVTAVVAAEPATPLVPDAVNTDVLKKLLGFMGHELDYCWEEVIALARKAS